ncbi:hypothetical protein [Dactylosporangium sp. NPDC051541]|uniref:hypothetical protein n=1 Tax=Dactylosporangium sp. NPDC051541 TaxID=3363977 RepID=UPI003796C05B
MLKVVAVLDIVVLGAVWLAAPGAGLGADPDAHALLVARALGTDLVVIGVMNWIVSRREEGLARAFLAPNFVMHAVPAAIIVAYIAGGRFGAGEWVGAVLHIVPALVLLGCLVVRPGVRVPSPPR